jgi:hypothetical protein
MQHESNQIHDNPDRVGLGGMSGGGIIIGVVDEVNGPGSQVCDGFPITRAELLLLARDYAKRALECERFRYYSGQVGSTDIRLIPYAWRRVSRIAEIVGDEPVDAVVKEVEEEMRKDCPDLWDAFVRGDKEYQKKCHEELHGQCD